MTYVEALCPMTTRRQINESLVIGVGNEFRGDDVAGLLVARRLDDTCPNGVRILEMGGDCTASIDLWETAGTVIIVDAAHSGSLPGTVFRFDAREGPIPSGLLREFSTHALGVAACIELARELNKLPPQLIVYAIEGHDFTAGAQISRDVALAAREVGDRILHELRPARIPGGSALPCTNPHS